MYGQIYTFNVLMISVVFSSNILQAKFSSSRAAIRERKCSFSSKTDSKAFLRRSAITSQYFSLGPAVTVMAWVHDDQIRRTRLPVEVRSLIINFSYSDGLTSAMVDLAFWSVAAIVSWSSSGVRSCGFAALAAVSLRKRRKKNTKQLWTITSVRASILSMTPLTAPRSAEPCRRSRGSCFRGLAATSSLFGRAVGDRWNGWGTRTGNALAWLNGHVLRGQRGDVFRPRTRVCLVDRPKRWSSFQRATAFTRGAFQLVGPAIRHRSVTISLFEILSVINALSMVIVAGTDEASDAAPSPPYARCARNDRIARLISIDTRAPTVRPSLVCSWNIFSL